ncbi:methyltransferase family protein [Sinobaca qinghaiensis]|uniref:Methyltransferase family protein n=1 Tax=Sinobaca qinghaiensis TaxID=342944 RepID=A0A419UX20_9BACL|nr:class I SAM-dependent methyltransferase [Sinobaca qinghaiensis]RKD69669.1 methyltransferase family protein [Sinobaca qinghaiensis]
MKDKALNNQHLHWEKVYAENKEKFGGAPSAAAVRAAELFKTKGYTHIMELGAGQGRDTLYFAQNGFHVHALEYTKEGIESIQKQAADHGLSSLITVTRHDVREPFPVAAQSIDACYSHMLYCMAMTTEELKEVSSHILHVLRPGGYNIYTVRHAGDPHYGTGIHHGEDLYEVNGFIVHFFDQKKIDMLADGYTFIEKLEWEEGRLPKRLYQVTLAARSDKQSKREEGNLC